MGVHSSCHLMLIMLASVSVSDYTCAHRALALCRHIWISRLTGSMPTQLGVLTGLEHLCEGAGIMCLLMCGRGY